MAIDFANIATTLEVFIVVTSAINLDFVILLVIIVLLAVTSSYAPKC